MSKPAFASCANVFNVLVRSSISPLKVTWLPVNGRLWPTQAKFASEPKREDLPKRSCIGGLWKLPTMRCSQDWKHASKGWWLPNLSAVHAVTYVVRETANISKMEQITTWHFVGSKRIDEGHFTLGIYFQWALEWRLHTRSSGETSDGTHYVVVPPTSRPTSSTCEGGPV